MLDVQKPGGLHWPAQDHDRPRRGELGWCLGLHRRQSTQDFLVSLDSLALKGREAHEKLAFVSIHAAIKARRERRGWSQERLAQEVSKIEGKPVDKPLAWQTVQQWEREGGTSPKRMRLQHVAQALGTTAAALAAGDDRDPAPVAADSTPEVENQLERMVALMRAINARDPQRFELICSSVESIEASLRTTDQMLREIHGVKGYVTPDRAAEKLKAPAPDMRRTGHEDTFHLTSGFGELIVAEPRPKPYGKKK